MNSWLTALVVILGILGYGAMGALTVIGTMKLAGEKFDSDDSKEITSYFAFFLWPVWVFVVAPIYYISVIPHTLAKKITETSQTKKLAAK